jgi:hypothetical protein
MNKENIEKQTMKEVAFLEDVSGKRSFLISPENQLYFSDSGGNLTETNKNMLASAIVKYNYEIPNEEGIKKVTD